VYSLVSLEEAQPLWSVVPVAGQRSVTPSAASAPTEIASSGGYSGPMAARQFSVRCATTIEVQPAPTPHDLPKRPSEQLVEQLTAGGLEEVIVVPDAQGEKVTIRGRAPAESKEDARTFVENAIVALTLDLVILEPGVWVDELPADHF
jgi:hypothetical protein